MPSRSNLRLTEVIRKRAAHVILYELKDPRMGFVTITKVKLAPDLSTCTIFWSVIGNDGQRSKTRHALDHARLFIQHRVAEGLHTRTAPVIGFEYDASIEGAIRMGDLLKHLRDERGDPPPEPDAEGAAPAAVADAVDPDATDDEPDDEPDEPSGDPGDGDANGAPPVP